MYTYIDCDNVFVILSLFINLFYVSNKEPLVIVLPNFIVVSFL